MSDTRRTRAFRKSAVAMMVVAGGLAAPAASYPPHALAQASKDSASIPSDAIKGEIKGERKARKATVAGKAAKKKTAIPCDGIRAQKKAGVMNPCQAKARKQDGVMNPCQVKAGK